MLSRRKASWCKRTTPTISTRSSSKPFSTTLDCLFEQGAGYQHSGVARYDASDYGVIMDVGD